MAYKIQKLNQISRTLLNDKKKFLKIICEDGKAKMREYVETHWYGTYTPKDYERTDEVLNSISADIVGDTVIIYYDESKISSFTHDDGWGSHIGFNGEPFDIGFIEYGVGGGSPNNPRIGDNANAIRRLRGWLSNYITRAVQQSFGVHVKVMK